MGNNEGRSWDVWKFRAGIICEKPAHIYIKYTYAMYLIYIFYLHLELFRFVSEGTPIIRTLEDDKLKVSVPG